MKQIISVQRKSSLAALRKAACGGVRRGVCLMTAALMMIAPASLWAQDLNVSGTVRDGSSTPVAGASVVVKGSTVGVSTDVNGGYTISAAADATLVFSFLGLATHEEPVNGRGRVDVTLSEGDQAIDEVVVIGYGVQRKEAVTGSVASMSGASLAEIPSSNITSALQGRLAGVEMTQTSSRPGAAMQIRIRGTRSLTASNDPLVVLDGIPFAGSIGDINPNDIKSVDILKDASATAIYGSRGANGVILITTNKGQTASKAQVRYNAYYGLKSAIKYPMMNGEEFLKLRQTAGRFTNTEDETGENDIPLVSTDWQDLILRTGVAASHDVNVTGGTQKGSYNFGLGYYRDEAVVPLQQYSRISLRASLDQEIAKYFRVGVNTTNNWSVSEGSQVQIVNSLYRSPIANPKNPDGTWRRTFKEVEGTALVWTKEYIESVADKWVSDNKALGSYNTLFGEVKIPGVEGLKYRMNLGLNLRMNVGGSFTGQGVGNANEKSESAGSISSSLTTNWAVENLLTYDRTFADKHQVNMVAMYSAEQTHYHSNSISARNIPADHFQYYNLGQALGEITANPDNQNYQLSGLISYMGRVMYSYDSRYMLTATFRSDASSRLAPGQQWHTYPAVSAGWNIREESFMESLSWLDRLKLRVGYGETSNQAVAPYATLGRLTLQPYNFGDTGYAMGGYVSALPNPELGWEFSETWNFGVDFTVLKNRLSGSVEYYRQHTKNVLLGVSLPPTSGVGSYTANIGETENKGFEFSLNGTILDNFYGFTWEAGVNLYVNRNKLLSLASGQERDEANSWFVGYPIDVVFDHEYVGLWNETDPDYADFKTLEPNGNIGMIKVKYTPRYDKDGKLQQIGAEDRQIMSLEPDFQGGFNTRVAYKGIDLSVIGTFKSGGTLISALHGGSVSYLNLMTGRRGNIKVDYWTPENTGAKYPNPAGEISGDALLHSKSLAYFDASYLKIRTISLGYTLEKAWLSKVGVDNLRIYATVQNPFVFLSPYHTESGLDPETNSYGDQQENVNTNRYNSRLPVIGNNTPSTKNYLMGLSITF
ncbi:MAG: TonB-dependent receptor [Prevotellaceae bacterium]|jgi:TonB-linked SusC/RagA family outer membrane protein|nr:TonB-dependent receptor [Prevotellaceae bacterium]